MNVQPRHIASKKRIGSRRDGTPVIEVLTKGGLYLVLTHEGGKPKTIGAGPHRAVARFMAEKAEPDITITELSKADYVPEESIRSVLPKYEAVRDYVNGLLDADKLF